ncbi:hypothetical protein Tco_1157009 [Tanacetum coccineum]
MAKDKAPSHPLVSTPVDTELHKEDLQTAGDPTSLGVTSEEGAHPLLSSGCDASADSTVEADPGISAPNDPIPSQQGVDKGTKNYSIDHIFTGTNPSTNEESGFEKMSEKIKMEDISRFMQDTRSAFFTHDSLPNEPVIVLEESEEEQTERHEEPKDTSDKLEQQKAKAKAEVASLKAKPPYPDIKQLTRLLVTSLKPELSKLLASHDFASSKPSETKELPSKISKLAREIQELKRHVQRMEIVGKYKSKSQSTAKNNDPTEIKLPEDLNDIPTKLETFTSTVSSIMSQTLDTLPSLLNKVANTLNMFASIMENASHIAIRKGVPLAGLATASPAEGEKRTNPTKKDVDITNMHNELVDLLGIDVVTRGRLLGSVPEPFSLSVLRRLGSIFTSVYAVDQKVKKSHKVYKAEKRLLYVKRNKAISLGKGTFKVRIEVQQLSLKDCTWYFRARLH